ncbi:response regulator receiver protein [Spirochaeta thermophila DSM 6578]|uniref:Response regulator receiver protein n=1 Tax=Winmispira thermophila (strain ATCC 700085 / DSM 6578 / Z-1203) TaxID=869211 RepID=G0GC28_WINT7|nr:response regulator [Spirochaeta thermophila]AEJ60392.1 response regulator receiver protein [Spirochaeta thermophila DSM 6578]
MKHIMVVDDSEVILRIVSQTLQMHGYSQILTASNGKDALPIIKEHLGKIALYIFDVNMPEMDGLSLLKEVRTLDKTTPIIMLTTETDKEKIMAARESGATGWIIKPFEGEKFIKVVKMYLG